MVLLNMVFDPASDFWLILFVVCILSGITGFIIGNQKGKISNDIDVLKHDYEYVVANWFVSTDGQEILCFQRVRNINGKKKLGKLRYVLKKNLDISSNYKNFPPKTSFKISFDGEYLNDYNTKIYLTLV